MFNPNKEEGGGTPMLDAETTIGQGVKIEGTFTGAGNVAVYGEVVGKFSTQGDLMVQEGARLEADVEAGNITVSGEIHGGVTCHGQLQLLASGKIYGDVTSEMFSVETGAVLQGTCTTGSNQAAPSKSEKPTEDEE